MSKLSIVMYHYVRDLAHSRYPNIRGLDYSLFKEQIRFLKDHYKIVTMEEVITSFTGSIELPEDALLLTFDDGYMDHYVNVMPVLLEEKVQGSFFTPGITLVEHKLLDVNKLHYVLASASIEQLLPDLFEQLDYYRGSEFSYPSNNELFQKYALESRYDNEQTIFLKRMLQTVLPEELRHIISSNLFGKYVGISEEKLASELYLNYDQMKCMQQCGMYIGLHGYDHYWLGNLEKDHMEKDISKALEVMSGIIDPTSWVMNYPYGSYNQEVVEFVKSKGCKIGLTTRVSIADTLIDNPQELPRLDTNDFPPKSNNYLHYTDRHL